MGARADQITPNYTDGTGMDDRPHALYRFFAADGTLLYVGITLDVGGRWKTHSKERPWWSESVGATLEHFPDRESALEAERVAIIEERPLHNVAHNGRRGRAKADQFAAEFFGPVIDSQCMPDLCHDYCEKASDGPTPIVYPWRWAGGTAHYVCGQGHAWTCGWGHTKAGEAPENGMYVIPFREESHRAFVRCPICGRTHNHSLGRGWREAHCGAGSYYLLESNIFWSLVWWGPGRDVLRRSGRLNSAILRDYREQAVKAAVAFIPHLEVPA